MPILNRLISILRRNTSGGKFIPEVDGLRFLAIFPVLIQHLSERLLRYGPETMTEVYQQSSLAFWAGRGTAGVYLFFVISGFILGLPFARGGRQSFRTSALRKFYWRRITRIEPPYILWMTLFAVVLWWQGTMSLSSLTGHWIGSLFYLHNILYGAYSVINPVAWSLEIEIQFYVLAPLLAWIVFQLVQRSRALFLIFAISGLYVSQYILGLDIMPWKASLLNTLQYFLLGFLLADLFQTGVLQKAKKGFRFGWDIIGFLALTGMFRFWSEDLGKEFLFALSLLLLCIAAFKGHFFSKMLSQPLLTSIGGMCYTIYLVHLPFFEGLIRYTAHWTFGSGTYLGWFLIQSILVLFPLLIFSMGAYLLFEKPFMNKNWPENWKQIISTMLLNLTAMKKQLKRITFFVLLLFFGSNLVGQSYSRHFKKEKDLSSLQLQPFPALVDAAIKNAPDLGVQDRKLEGLQYEIQMTRRDWLKNLQVGGSYLLNNGLYADAIETVNANSFALTNRKNTVYNFGFSFRLPISSLTNKSTQLKKINTEVEIEHLRKQELESQIRISVMEIYQEIMLQKRMLKIRTEALESNRLTLELAETYFKKGAVELDQLTRAVSQKNRAEEELEQTWTLLITSIMTLEEFCGTQVTIN